MYTFPIAQSLPSVQPPENFGVFRYKGLVSIGRIHSTHKSHYLVARLHNISPCLALLTKFSPGRLRIPGQANSLVAMGYSTDSQ